MYLIILLSCCVNEPQIKQWSKLGFIDFILYDILIIKICVLFVLSLAFDSFLMSCYFACFSSLENKEFGVKEPSMDYP